MPEPKPLGELQDHRDVASFEEWGHYRDELVFEAKQQPPDTSQPDSEEAPAERWRAA